MALLSRQVDTARSELALVTASLNRYFDPASRRVQAAATLLRFGKVTPKNLQKSLVVMTDLAAKTGDMESASNLLAKALADPAKAAGKLAKAGVVLTKAQQDTIKEMVKQNDLAGAQAFILDELAKTTGGAAAASQGKYARSIAVLNDVVEDAQKALAVGFLPVIEKVADKLSTAVADPKFLKGLEDFGKELAGGLDDIIDIAVKLPWATIGDSLKLAGTGAKAVLNAFTSLPPWVQTAVLTGWGLNKLTGGALSGIVGTLASGLVKGILGINAGVVNITAATVNGPGGGLPGAAKGVGGLGLAAAGAAGIGVAIVGITQGAAVELATAVGGNIGGEAQKNVGGGPLNIFGPFSRLFDALSGDLRSPLQKIDGTGQKLHSKLETLRSEQAKLTNVSNERLEAIRNVQSTAKAAAIADSRSERTTAQTQAAKIVSAQAAEASRTRTTTTTASAAVKAATERAAAASREAGRTAAAAIRDKDLSVTFKPSINISQKFNISQSIATSQKFNKIYKVAI